MPLLNIVHINLHVADLERSIAFYEKLGFKLMFDLGRHSAHDLVRIDINPRLAYGGIKAKAVVMSLGDDPRAATKIELMEPVEPKPLAKPVRRVEETGVHRIAIRVKDIDGTVAALRAKGIDIPDAPHEIRTMGARQRYVLFADPDDNLIELIELYRS